VQHGHAMGVWQPYLHAELCTSSSVCELLLAVCGGMFLYPAMTTALQPVGRPVYSYQHHISA
jgi:hypothetical protein